MFTSDGGTRAYTYKVTVAPVGRPVSLEIFKAHIKKSNALEDTLLALYLDAAIQYAEKFTKRDLITRTYQTFRDYFPGGNYGEGYYTLQSEAFSQNFEIRKSPLQSVEAIEYKDSTSGLWVTVASLNYYHTLETDYSEIGLNPGYSWPENVLRTLDAVRITFKSGFADTDAGISADWKTAILAHAASLWANRGDCSESGCANSLPGSSFAFYSQNRIISL